QGSGNRTAVGEFAEPPQNSFQGTQCVQALTGRNKTARGAAPFTELFGKKYLFFNLAINKGNVCN
ncbi:MAG: hypothetical protein EAZ89_14070, partial [Bacteroidetes bacterium]